ERRRDRVAIQRSFHREGRGKYLRGYQVTPAPSWRSAVQTGFFVTAAAALGLAWYTSPEKVAGYLAHRAPHVFSADNPAPKEQASAPLLSLPAMPERPHTETPAHLASISMPHERQPAIAPVMPPFIVEPPFTVATMAEPSGPLLKVVEVHEGDTLID